MKKETYILILFLLSSGVLGNIFTSVILTKDVMVVLVLLWGLYGYLKYNKEANPYINTKTNISVVIWITAILFLSTIVPSFEYEQSIKDALISQRFNYTFLLLFVLLKISPSFDEIVRPLRLIAYISIFEFILSIYQPEIFLTKDVLEDMMESRMLSGSTDIGMVAPGFRFATVYAFIAIAQLLKQPTKRVILEAIVLVLYIIVYQNRSTIIGTVPFFIYCFYKMDSQNKARYTMIGIIGLVFLLPFLTNIYDSLMHETESQLNDEDYERWNALAVYGIDAKTNIFEVLLGNGIWSKSGRYSEMMSRIALINRAQISDLGWIGTFYYYGIVPMIILFVYVYKALRNGMVPYFVKFFALWIIFVPTIHGYLINNIEANMPYVLFFYFIMYFSVTPQNTVPTPCNTNNTQYARG